MYAHHVLFGEDRRAFEESRFWFQDGLHAAEPIYPFDSFAVRVCRRRAQSGELPLLRRSAIARRRVSDPQRLRLREHELGHRRRGARPRAELFARRGGHYYEHWDELYERWLDKVEAATASSIALEVPGVGEFEDESIVTEGRGLGSSHALLQAYDRLIEGVDRIFQYHFEFLNLGYGAYFVFYEQCRQAFPEITDQTIAKMVSAIDVLVLRPDDELRRLAGSRSSWAWPTVGRRRERGRARRRSRGQRCRRTVARRLRGDEGPVVLLLLRNGRLPSPPSLLDRRHQVPDRGRSARTSRGSRPARTSRDPARQCSQSGSASPRSTARCSRPELRSAFDDSLALARTVFPYVENHNFYIDHRYLTIFWNKVREFGALLARHGFLARGRTSSCLRHDEVRSALEELRLHWSSGGAGVARGPRTGRSSSSGEGRSTTRCASGLRPRLSAGCPRRSPSR